jgi:hypothetical protein
VRPKVTRLAVDEKGWGKPRALRRLSGCFPLRKSLLLAEDEAWDERYERDRAEFLSKR